MKPPYVMGYATAVVDALGRRSGAVSAAFLRPHLRPGVRLLDCGCGPGSITVDLAEQVAPGLVVGIDLEAEQFQLGRARSRARRLRNLAFQRADVRALPIASEAVDAVFMNGVLGYQGDDAAAVLAEVRRVLRPGGVVAICDVDYGGGLLAPGDPRLERAWQLVHRVFQAHGADPFGARAHRARLRAAGFVRVYGSATSESYGDPESTREAGFFWAFFLGRMHAGLVVERGWAERGELKELCDALIAWGQHPDAFFVRCRCEALGFKPDPDHSRGPRELPRE